MSDKTFTVTVPAPDFIVPEEGAEGVVYITPNEDGHEMSENQPIDVQELFKTQSELVSDDVNKVGVGLRQSKQLKEKAFERSNQTKDELGHSSIGYAGILEQKIQPLPFDPECFANFLEISEVHSSCVNTKVEGAVGRKYLIKPTHPIKRDGENEDDEVIGDEYITAEAYAADRKKIQTFINNCNEELSFEEVLKLAAEDRQAIGWGAFEVIREASGKIARLQRVPAVRLRVLEGFLGYVEHVGYDSKTDKTQYTFYQRFGDKVVTEVPDPFDFAGEGKTVKRPYDPEEDGELKIGDKISWNLVSKKDGKPIEDKTGYEAFREAANEILYLPNNHNNTVYYGYPDVLPAISAILGNVYIRDYLHQFFEHNCVPRWAVIVKGAKLDDKFKKYISDYLSTNVKGKSHQTMVLTFSGLAAQNISVEFKKLDADAKEADFINTKGMHNQEIMTAERVPAAMIGVNEKSSLGSRGLGQAEIFKDYVITPLQQYYARKLNKLFRLGLGVLNAKIEFMELDVRDSLTKAQILQILNNLGAKSINDVRDEYGDAAIDGGNVYYVRIRDGRAIKVSDLANLLYNSEAAESPNIDDETVIQNHEQELNDARLATDTGL